MSDIEGAKCILHLVADNPLSDEILEALDEISERLSQGNESDFFEEWFIDEEDDSAAPQRLFRIERKHASGGTNTQFLAHSAKVAVSGAFHECVRLIFRNGSGDGEIR